MKVFLRLRVSSGNTEFKTLIDTQNLSFLTPDYLKSDCIWKQTINACKLSIKRYFEEGYRYNIFIREVCSGRRKALFECL